MFNWKKRKRKIEELESRIQDLSEGVVELCNEVAKLKRIVHHSFEEKPFTINYRTVLSHETNTLIRDRPVLYIYRNGNEYSIPFESYDGWTLHKEDCELRFEGNLVYFKAVFRHDGEPSNVCNFIIDYEKGTYIRDMIDQKEKELTYGDVYCKH